MEHVGKLDNNNLFDKLFLLNLSKDDTCNNEIVNILIFRHPQTMSVRRIYNCVLQEDERCNDRDNQWKEWKWTFEK